MVATGARPLRRRSDLRRRQAGYNLVALMVIVAVVNIAIAASLPMWSKVIQRDKESVLVFRGLQYAEAIRVFQKRTGRFPTRLEELIEIEPRCIRQLWLDPMNEEPEWGLVLAGAEGLDPGLQSQTDAGLGTNRERSSLREERRRRRDQRDRERDRRRQGRQAPEETISPRQRIEDRGGGRRGVPRAGEQVTRGPIIGVHSLSEGTAIRSFEGGTSYKDWKFTTELLPQFGVENAGENVPRLHSNWIGRAYPAGAEPVTEGGMPDSPLDRKDDSRSRNRRNRRNDRERR
ncbi:MAG: type II secretion system protein [bacterium]|nr:type II secretion system protein [bacterium]